MAFAFLLPAVFAAPSSLVARQQVDEGPASALQGHDVDSVPAARGLLRGEDRLLGGLLLGSLAATQLDGLEEIDGPLSPHAGEGTSLDRRIPRNLGRVEVAGGLAAGTYLVGAVVGSPATRRIGLRGIEAMGLNYALTAVVKIGVGRARPDSGLDDADDLHPLSFSKSNWSFPSGHTSTMFALATVVSGELADEAPWVPFVAYPLATWVGVSRVLDDRHWPTDIVAGAALGVLSGRLIERLHVDATPAGGPVEGPAPRLFLAPVGTGTGVGVEILLP